MNTKLEIPFLARCGFVHHPQGGWVYHPKLNQEEGYTPKDWKSLWGTENQFYLRGGLPNEFCAIFYNATEPIENDFEKNKIYAGYFKDEHQLNIVMEWLKTKYKTKYT